MSEQLPTISDECCGQRDRDGTCAAPACIFGDAMKAIQARDVEIARLRAALAPFARLSEYYPGAHAGAVLGPIHDARCRITMGDCHAARAITSRKLD